MNWFTFLAWVSLITGSISLSIGTSVHLELLQPLSAKPIVMACFYAVFPIFFVFVIQGVIEKDDEESGKSRLSLEEIKIRIINTFESIKVNWQFSIAALILFCGGILLWQEIGLSGVHHSSGEPFEQVHALRSPAGASIFMSITVFGFSSKAKEVCSNERS